MSTLTKISVVLLAVLVLAACPVFIQQSIVPPNWKAAYEKQLERAKVAEAQSASEQMAADTWKKWGEQSNLTLALEKQNNLTQLASKDTRIAELATLQGTNAAKLNELNAALTGLKTNFDNQVQLTQTLNRQLDVERQKGAEQGDQLRRSQDAIRENIAQMEILNKTVRALKEQLTDKDKEIVDLRERLERGGSVKTGTSAAAPVRGAKIEGSVTAVKNGLASLNVGLADGVQKNMRFYIYRNADFVAYLRIDEVHDASCAGIITEPQRDVRAGDKAASSLE